MKNIIFNKFLTDLIKLFLLCSLSISLIVWVIQAVNFLDFVSEDGHSFKIYFLYTLLNFPKIFSRILPFVFFISFFLILIKYENTNELIIYWLNGITKIKFINFILKISIIFVFLQLVLVSFIVPNFQDLARSYIRSSNIDFFPSLIKERKFVDTVSDLTIYVDKIEENGTLRNIFLEDDRGTGKSQIVFAKKGELIYEDQKKFLVLSDGNFINKDLNETTIFQFDVTDFNLSGYVTKSTTFPKIKEIKTITLIGCFVSIIKKTYDFSSNVLPCVKNESVKNLKNITQELLGRFFLPFYLPAFALISSILIVYSKNEKKYHFIKPASFFLGIVALMLSEISIRYSAINNFSSLLFILMPIFITITFYYYLKKKITFKVLSK